MSSPESGTIAAHETYRTLESILRNLTRCRCDLRAVQARLGTAAELRCDMKTAAKLAHDLKSHYTALLLLRGLTPGMPKVSWMPEEWVQMRGSQSPETRAQSLSGNLG